MRGQYLAIAQHSRVFYALGVVALNHRHAADCAPVDFERRRPFVESGLAKVVRFDFDALLGVGQATAEKAGHYDSV